MRTAQPKTHAVKPLRHQTELALTNEPVNQALPEATRAECRQLLGQMLQQVLGSEKEVHDEH
jgi:hypothetical protein